MKTPIYWISALVLLIAEAVAVYIAYLLGEPGFYLAGVIHLVVAASFGLVTGIYRKSISIAILSFLVISTTPGIGLLTMILINDKFNSETQERFLTANEGFTTGNPFVSIDGSVEMADNQFLTGGDHKPILRRLLSADRESTEREVAVLASIRDLSTLPVLEKVASTSSGGARVLAQAAVLESTDRVANWAENLHRLSESGKPVPMALERLAVTSYLRLKKHGQSAQVFGLPRVEVLQSLLQLRLQRSPQDMESARLLCDLLISQDAFEEADQLIEENRNQKGFSYLLEKAKVFSARGDWMQLLKIVPDLDKKEWKELSGDVRTFWGAG